jgi:predicted Rossmann-fold nucleotide-binding protein
MNKEYNKLYINISSNENYTQQINQFKQDYGITKIIAISGGADINLEGIEDINLQRSYKEVMEAKQFQIINQLIRKLQGYRIAILSGGTKWGIPNTAIKCARQYGIKTIGVTPLTGKKHAVDLDFLDLQIIVDPQISESYWGDESSIFTKLLDGVIVYGGNAGTLVEIAHILKMNEALIKYKGLPKYIIPITGSGGVADGLPFIWAKPHVKSASMPNNVIFSGREAAHLLIEKLELDDYLNIVQ